jgi:methyltransferase-like protein
MVFNTIKFVKKKKLLWEIIAAAAITIALVILLLNLPDTDQEIRMMRLKVFWVRSEIDNFYNAGGKYPNTLRELEDYIKNTSKLEFDVISFKENISNPKGIKTESDVLNGKGGWYYDKTKGELRLNIVQPIKYYKKFYFGKYRNDIPSDW